MPVSRDEVIAAYRMLLAREPESEEVIETHRDVADWHALREAFWQSTECRVARQMGRPEMDRLYDGVTGDDEALLLRYLAPGAPEAGFVGNFLGTRMQADFTVNTLLNRTGFVGGFNS